MKVNKIEIRSKLYRNLYTEQEKCLALFLFSSYIYAIPETKKSVFFMDCMPIEFFSVFFSSKSTDENEQ